MSYYGYKAADPYQPGQTALFKLSRSKVELFIQCQRCFWLDQRLKIKRPSMPAFLINSAVDELLKSEFDIYRKQQKPHPLQTKFGIDAIPYSHEELDDWRYNFTGVQYTDSKNGFILYGAVDDIWINSDQELMVVDYKATAKTKEITQLDPIGGWHDSYRRQMEFYQWLLRQKGFKVSATGYFVYANGDAKLGRFDDKVEFRTNVFPYLGKDDWIGGTIDQIKSCLESDMPANAPDCEHCNYTAARLKLTFAALRDKKTV